MNREVELVLSGLHASGQEQESEAVETVQPAQYFKRNDSHYLLYEEKMDEDQARGGAGPAKEWSAWSGY